jgi:hypothetical protein
MDWIRANLPITLGFALSVLLHLFLFLPAVGLLGSGATARAERAALRGSELEMAQRDRSREEDAQGRAQSADNARKALQERRDRQDPVERREEEVRLGIDRSSANTLNWIGYEEYERHLAELAEVEQAAYRLAVASGSRGDASPLLPPAPPSPSVAVSPEPSPLPLPAAARGSEAETAGTPTAGVPAERQASQPPEQPTAVTDARAPATQPAPPLPPPEMAASPEQRSDSGRPDERVPPSDDPAAPAVAPDASAADDDRDTKNPPTETEPSALPVVRPVDGTRPAPPPADPSRTDPRSEPRTDPTADPVADPMADPTTTTPPRDPKSPPTDPLDPAPPVERPTRPSEQPPSEQDDPATNPAQGTEGAGERSTEEIAGETGGGVEGPTPTDGATSEPAAPSPAGDPGETTAKRGELSDRESDATSIIEVPMNAWHLGRPLAAQGIVLRPVRPRFTVLNRLDGIARNPIGELVLGRDGIPISARVVRSTGNPGVDQSIRSALFKWRASGEQLEKLKPGQTLTIRLRLIMLQD